MTSEHRRADDSNGMAARPVARVVTLKQLWGIVTAILTLVTLLQTLGLKFVADSYIDQRIKIHNGDPKAHEGTIASAIQDSDRLHRQLDELRRDINDATKAMNDTNQRLARIEGALGRGAR